MHVAVQTVNRIETGGLIVTPARPMRGTKSCFFNLYYVNYKALHVDCLSTQHYPNDETVVKISLHWSRTVILLHHHTFFILFFFLFFYFYFFYFLFLYNEIYVEKGQRLHK